MPPGAHAGGSYDGDSKTMNLPLSILTAPTGGAIDAGEVTFVLGHELQHGFNHAATDHAYATFNHDVTALAQSAAAVHDYTPATAALIGANRRDEAGAEIAGFNAIVSRVRSANPHATLDDVYRAQPGRMGDFLQLDTTATPPAYRAMPDLHLNADLTLPATAANIEAMGKHYFDKAPAQARLGYNGNSDYAKLQAITDAMVSNAQTQSALQRVQSPFRATVPQYDVEIDRIKTQTLHVTTDQVFATLSTYLGSSFVNQFNKFGRVFQVYTQADAQSRLTVRDIANMQVRNQNGDMIPIGTVAKITPAVGPSLISLYNLYPSATVIGLPAQGYSSGQSLSLMEQIAHNTLPPGTGYEWTAMSYQEKAVSNQIYYTFGLAMLLVYLVLAGQYESWFTPISVILAVPLSLLGPTIVLEA